MVGAILMILYGIILFFWGAKIFWASFFIGLGLYILYTYYKAFKRKTIQKTFLRTSIKKIIDENDSETAANIISEKIKYPVGTKFVIKVITDETKVNLVFPLGILLSMKPLLYSFKPLLKKAIISKLKKENKYIDFDIDEAVNAIIESVDYLFDFYGDFVDVETDGGKTKIKIYVA
ncbi:hypothetical protein SAMN02745164_01097 [Marinitoga hydrogenitolerans DSM 16785]|uniref:Uncharacterized protein n=1 Tax=Marinitoga hydrogenitolerans (strain DSM 16785 / JCM 12826 / AT1271) TaxID=1122195 RepID=A0A1M4W5H1_MARH1|nr:hypothetical protein [Marinitoga hydrogenitolerans]SHE76508.1 hypothetical protein SAMN02745164_01097 [Marinitoga hydrogenitolerans DSM 16785]